MFSLENLFLWPLLLLLGLIPLLYLFRRKAKPLPSSTYIFYQSLAKEFQDSPWLRRLKRLFSLLLALLILLFLCLSILNPTLNRFDSNLSQVILLIDRSASMSLRNEDGQTQLQRGIQQCIKAIENFPPGVKICLVAYDQRCTVLQPFTTKKHLVLNELKGIKVRPIEDRIDRTEKFIKDLSAIHKDCSIWHISDQAPPNKSWTSLLPLKEKPPINVGISSFQIRRSPLQPNSIEVFIEVGSSLSQSDSTEEEREVKVHFFLSNKLISVHTLEASYEEPGRFVLPLQGLQNGILKAQISHEGDVLALDNTVEVQYQEAQSLKILRVSEDPDPFLTLALETLKQSQFIELISTSEFGQNTDADLTIFERVPLPKNFSSPCISIEPPNTNSLLSPQQLKEQSFTSGSLNSLDPTHPLLYSVQLERLQLVQQHIYKAGPRAKILIHGDSGPLLTYDEEKKQMGVGFSLMDSPRLTQTVSFPLWIGNAIYTLCQNENPFRTFSCGQYLNIKDNHFKWIDSKTSIPKETTTLELDRQGLFEDHLGSGSSFLLSLNETRLFRNPKLSAQVDHPLPIDQLKGSFLAGPLRALLLIGLCFFLLLEAWLFHRRAVY